MRIVSQQVQLSSVNRHVAGRELRRRIKQCIWLTNGSNALSFDVNSVAETLTTHTYQELAFCGPNNMIL